MSSASRRINTNFPTASAPANRSAPVGSARAWPRYVAVLLLLGLIAFGIAWLLGWIQFTTDPRVLEIRLLQENLRQQFVASGGPTTLLQAQEGVRDMELIQEKIKSLPKDLRPEVERNTGGMFQSAMRLRIKAYFGTPPANRPAELDRQINQEELMRKAWEASRAVASTPSGRTASSETSGSPQGSPQGGTGTGSTDNRGGSSRGGTGGGTEETRNKWRKSMIDRTTPEQRAEYVEYRRAMEERRKQLGLPTMGPR